MLIAICSDDDGDNDDDDDDNDVDRCMGCTDDDD